MIAFIYIPILQRELDVFRASWNNHRGRKQKQKQLPDGVPNHIHAFPRNYGGQKCGYHVEDEDLHEVTELSGVVNSNNDYLMPIFQQQCQQHIPDMNLVRSSEAANAYLLLKANLNAGT